MWRDLIGTARRLAKASVRKPRQSDLKRSVSTAYYALFHALAWDCADLFAGTQNSADPDAWRRVYRTLDHGTAKNACRNARSRDFPKAILAFADTFVSMQEERHLADYDPYKRYAREDVLVSINECEQAIEAFYAEARTVRRSFAVWILMQRKR